MPAQFQPDTNPLIELECACATVRRTARLVTQLYSSEMGSGVEPAQFSLLFALKGRPGATQSALGRALGLDKTTMSRNLRLLQRNAWIEPAPGKDRRERGYRLAPAGKKILSAAYPGWKRAQEKLRSVLKPGEWESAMRTFNRVAAVAQSERSSARDLLP